MNWTILDGFDTESRLAGEIGTRLTERLEQAGKQYAYFKLKEMNLAACRSCGGCNFKSPGKCVVKDDLHEVLQAVAPSDVVVFLTPIRFGGYPSQLKKVLEKFMVLGYPLYTVKGGKLLHPMRYCPKSLLSIGVPEVEVAGQAESFRLHLKRNAQNLIAPHHRAVIVGESALEIDPAVEEAIAW